MSTETSTQRPWAAVAPWPEDRFLPKVGAHYTAMAWAHMLAYRAALVAAVKLDSEDQIQDAVRQAEARHGNPMSAAFVAVALLAGWTAAAALEALADADATEGELYEWLTAANIDAAQIAAAL